MIVTPPDNTPTPPTLPNAPGNTDSGRDNALRNLYDKAPQSTKDALANYCANLGSDAAWQAAKKALGWSSNSHAAKSDARYMCSLAQPAATLPPTIGQTTPNGDIYANLNNINFGHVDLSPEPKIDLGLVFPTTKPPVGAPPGEPVPDIGPVGGVGAVAFLLSLFAGKDIYNYLSGDTDHTVQQQKDNDERAGRSDPSLFAPGYSSGAFGTLQLVPAVAPFIVAPAAPAPYEERDTTRALALPSLPDYFTFPGLAPDLAEARVPEPQLAEPSPVEIGPPLVPTLPAEGKPLEIPRLDYLQIFGGRPGTKKSKPEPVLGVAKPIVPTMTPDEGTQDQLQPERKGKSKACSECAEEEKNKPKKKRQPRTQCFKGTYQDTKWGHRFHPTMQVDCDTGSPFYQSKPEINPLQTTVYSKKEYLARHAKPKKTAKQKAIDVANHLIGGL